MKVASTGNSHKGFSTVEILISLAILTLTITAVILLVFGNQSLTIDTQTNVEALAKAEAQIEGAQAKARGNFLSLESVASSIDDIYTKELVVTDRSECQKEAISTVSWQRGGRPLSVSLSTLMSDLGIALALSGDCDSTPPGNWDNPLTATSLALGGFGATDIDVYQGRVYITSNPTSAAKLDLYIYDFDENTLTLTERSKTHFGDGFNAVDIVRDPITNEFFAYALEDANSGQLRVIDVTNPDSPTEVAAETLPNMTATCPPTLKLCMAGISIYAYDGLLYIGTSYISNIGFPESENNELHIYDISIPSSPVWIGSANVNHNIYSIAARGDYAYLALSGTGESVRIYDVSDPSDPSQTGGFDPVGDEYSTALYLIGNRLYVGREDADGTNDKDFYILDITDPSDDPIELGSAKLNLNPNSFIRGVVVKGDLAFVAIDNSTVAFKILNISNPANITNHTTCTSLNFSENTTALDLDGDNVFVANRSGDELRVIRDQVSACAS